MPFFKAKNDDARSASFLSRFVLNFSAAVSMLLGSAVITFATYVKIINLNVILFLNSGSSFAMVNVILIAGIVLLLLGIINALATCYDRPGFIVSSVCISLAGLITSVILVSRSTYLTNETFVNSHLDAMQAIQSACCIPPTQAYAYYTLATTTPCAWLSLTTYPNTNGASFILSTSTICDSPTIFSQSVSTLIVNIVLGFFIAFIVVASTLLCGLLINISIFIHYMTKICTKCFKKKDDIREVASLKGTKFEQRKSSSGIRGNFNELDHRDHLAKVVEIDLNFNPCKKIEGRGSVNSNGIKKDNGNGDLV